MWNAKRPILIITLICAVMVPVCSARSKAKSKKPTAFELLDRYEETQAKIRSSFISKHETAVKWEGYDKLKPNIKKGLLYERHIKVELCSDGTKYYSFFKQWGDKPGGLPTTEERAGIVQVLWDGEARYQYMYSPDIYMYTPDISAKARLENGRLFLTPKAMVTSPPNRICDAAEGGQLRGFFYGSNERIDSDIRQAETISLQHKTEKINGSQCYVINARTKRCKYKIWIDPEHDYHIAKARVNRKWGSASRPEKRRMKPPDGTSQNVMENVLFKKVNNIWLPVECDYTLNVELVGGAYSRAHYHHKVTEYVVNPDHDALGSFEPDFIRDGAVVKLIGVRGISYTWQDGKVVDKKGREVDVDKLIKAESEKVKKPKPKRK
ncbi:MAG: hypothetical protein FVQ85_04715 [Planctomycetes bacterium]|nr:hypothetical protein [Planctomycetota bacterium]